jgi:hypothetical protein
MINATMRQYDYFTFGNDSGYGQPQLSTEPNGKVKICINLLTQAISDSPKYKDCTYIGLTHDKTINDTYVIDYNGTKLKVLYINPNGRYIQAFMGEI